MKRKKIKLADLLPPDACSDGRKWLIESKYTDPNEALENAPIDCVDWLADRVATNEYTKNINNKEMRLAALKVIKNSAFWHNVSFVWENSCAKTA